MFSPKLKFLSAICLPLSLISFGSVIADNTIQKQDEIVEMYQYHISDDDILKQAALHSPYSKEQDEILELSCVEKSPTEYHGENRTLVGFSRRWKLDEIRKHFQLDTKTEIGIGWFKGNARTNFVHEMYDNSYGSSFIYRAYMELKDKTIVKEPKLNERGQRYAHDPLFFKEKCGDSYVTTLHRYGEIVVSVNLDFHDQDEKRIFEGEVGFNVPIGNFKATMKQHYERHQSQGTVTVKALQIGGDAKRLGEILGAKPGEPAPITQCRLDNLDKCDVMLGNIVNYTTNVFPQQLNDDGSERHGPAIKGFKHTNYDMVTRPRIPRDVQKSRQSLAEKYQEIQQDIHVVKHLLTIVNETNGYDYRKRLLNIKSILDNNLGEVKYAGLACFNEIENCVEITKETLKYLDQDQNKFDRDNLKINKNRDRIAYVREGKGETVYGWDGHVCIVPSDQLEPAKKQYVFEIIADNHLCGDPLPGYAKELMIRWQCENNGLKADTIGHRKKGRIECGYA